jgi:hypothetical protein
MIPDAIAVAGHQVAGGALEDHVAVVGGELGVVAVTVALRPGGIGRHALDRPALQVLDEDVRGAIAVAGHQVAGVTLEDHVAAVGGELGVGAATLPCTPAASVDTRWIAPLCRSLTKMSEAPLLSPATRLLAVLSKTT